MTGGTVVRPGRFDARRPRPRGSSQAGNGWSSRSSVVSFLPCRRRRAWPKPFPGGILAARGAATAEPHPKGHGVHVQPEQPPCAQLLFKRHMVRIEIQSCPAPQTARRPTARRTALPLRSRDLSVGLPHPDVRGMGRRISAGNDRGKSVLPTQTGWYEASTDSASRRDSAVWPSRIKVHHPLQILPDPDGSTRSERTTSGSRVGARSSAGHACSQQSLQAPSRRAAPHETLRLPPSPRADHLHLTTSEPEMRPFQRRKIGSWPFCTDRSSPCSYKDEELKATPTPTIPRVEM